MTFLEEVLKTLVRVFPKIQKEKFNTSLPFSESQNLCLLADIEST